MYALLCTLINMKFQSAENKKDYHLYNQLPID